jgi:uncharacterized protein (TIGR03437 family)
MLAIIYGSNFGTTAANVSVSVGGKAAYVYSPVTAAQFTVELPFEASTGPTTLTVTVGGTQSAPFNITLAAIAPALGTQNGTGSGLGLVYETAGTTPVTLKAPAHDGDTLLVYAVGLGPTSPVTATGPASATNPTATPVTLTVGGVTSKVLFAGVPQGLAGVYQINFTVPANVQGTQPLVATINGQSTSAAVTTALAGLSSIVNSGSFASPGTASPGSIVTAFANSLGTTTDELAGLFPSSKAEGVQVTFNGTPAPLFNVVASTVQQQVDLFVPTELPTSGTVNVQLTTSTALYPNYALTMVPANPGFYRLQDPTLPARFNIIAQFAGTAWLALPASTTTGLGLPACSSSLTALSTCGQPATIGDTLVVYATGLGLATPNGNPNGKPLATGTVPPADGSVLYETPTTPVVTVGGIPAKVLFSGLVPGVAGEYQVDIQIPSGVTNGDDVPVQLTILGASDMATISIQPRAN